jgi:protein-disulfide isomerase
MTRTRWIIFGLICLLTLGGLVASSKKNSIDVSSTDPAKIITGANGDHVFGNADAKVILFEYGDFQCPGCGGAYPQLKTITEKYKDKIAFVFRNFPLTSIHPNALAAATVAEAAAQQGKYWEMHDKLYETQGSWTNVSASARGDVFLQYARDLGLNTDQFTKDLSGKTVADKIARDRALAGKLKVDSTPTIYINNEKASSAMISDLAQAKGDLLTKKLDENLKN